VASIRGEIDPALHLAQLRGAEVFGTASASKHAELSASGAVVFDYKQKEWIREMQRLGAWILCSIRLDIGALMRAIPFCARAASWLAMARTCLLRQRRQISGCGRMTDYPEVIPLFPQTENPTLTAQFSSAARKYLLCGNSEQWITLN
jgi:hypothetical protein